MILVISRWNQAQFMEYYQKFDRFYMRKSMEIWNAHYFNDDT